MHIFCYFFYIISVSKEHEARSKNNQRAVFGESEANSTQRQIMKYQKDRLKVLQIFRYMFYIMCVIKENEIRDKRISMKYQKTNYNYYWKVR